MQYHQSADVQRENSNLGSGALIVLVILLILSVSASSPIMAQSPSDKAEGTNPLAPQASPDAETAGTTTVFLPLISKSTVAFNSDEEKPPSLLARQQNTDHVGLSPVAPPLANHDTFVTDTDGWLDQYLGRADLPNGLLTFTIGVNAPVLRADQVGAEGLPTLPAFLQLMEDKTLPRFAQLILQVWDIDDEQSLACPQIDHVYVNGQQLENLQQSAPAVLRSGNGQWNTWSIGFPAYLLKYPTTPGQNGQLPAPVLNEIAIAVDTACNPPHWKVEVDWGVIALGANPKYPILFVHGWTGSEDTFKPFHEFAKDSGISEKRLDMDGGIEDLFLTATTLKNQIVAALNEFGTKKVNIVTHSRGGIFTRSMLRQYPEMAESVANYVTISTPHHGVDAPVNWLSNNYDWTLIGYWFDSCNRFSGEDEAKCEVAAEQLTKERMRAFNYGKCKQYVVFLANWFDLQWEPCFPQWTQGGSTEATVTSYTINGGVLDVEPTSATFPWVARAAGEYPFPTTAQLDGYFPLASHTSIVKSREVFDYVIALLNLAPITTTMRAAQTSVDDNAQRAAQTPSLLEDEKQTLGYQAGQIAANGLVTFTLPVEAMTAIRFRVMVSNPVSVTLVNPVGLLIDPNVADNDPQITYDVAQGDSTMGGGWRYEYAVQTPITGTWQIQIVAQALSDFAFYAEIDSPVRLVAIADADTYHPGDTIVVQAGLVDGHILQPGATITGLAFLPDETTLPLIFYDDGTHGDATANDRFYATQITAPTLNGWLRFVLQATQGNLVRVTDLSFPVAAQTASVQGVVNETPIDTNDNGYYDVLNLAIALNVQTAGDYTIRGVLADGNGDTVASASYVTIGEGTQLAVGTQTVTLSFNGKSVRKAGQNGPYTLKELQIDYYDPTAYESFTVDTAENVYTTTSYTVNQFEGEFLQMTGSSDGAEDVNSDGIYDSLQISVTFDVLLPGAYNWVGELVDANGDHVTGASGSGALNSQTPAVFTFGGWQLHNAGLNGPYRLTNVYVTKTTDQVFTEYFDDLHTTAAYQASQFGSLPLLLTNVQHQLVDRNSNGLTDRLVMSATLSAMVLDGAYNWSGRLTDPNGVEIGTTAGTSQLYDGKTLVFAFINTPLIRNSGLNGPFSLRDVTITSRETPTITAAFPVVYTTPAYPATQFEAWNFSFTNNSATVSDLDNNGLYDKLTFATTLSVPWAGPYRLDSKLIALQPTERTLITYTLFSTYAGVSSESFTFDGPDLAQDGVDGPYLLRITGVYADDSIPALSLAITQDLTTTLPYSATQFQSFPLLPPPDAPVLAQPLNDDNDGNYLMTWSTIPDATGYELQEHRVSILLPPYETIYTGTTPSFAISGRTGGTYAYRVRTVRGAQVSGWSQSINVAVDNATPTPTPTKTTTPTPTPTLSPTPTPVPTLLTDAVLYMSSESGGTVSGVSFADEDLIAYNTVTGVWSMVFDGSDVGITTADLDAVHVESDGTLLLSFDVAVTLAGVGTVEDEDIVRFTPTTLGDSTAGSFSWVFDGSDVGLDTASEDIDALARTPDGNLVLSTIGAFSADGVTGVAQDLFVFTDTSLGETTSGTWAFYFDGEDVGLTSASEDIWGVEVATNGDIYLTTYSTYAVTGLSGDSDDFFACSPITLGETTACSFNLYWDGDSYGVGSEWLDALAIIPISNATPTPGATSSPTATASDTPTPTVTPLPTDTPLPTNTPLPGDTPTATPTAAGSGDVIIYVSSESGGTVSGVSFADNDLIAYNTVTGVWSMVFDGSDVGITTADLDAVHVESDGTLLLSFDVAVTLSGVGTVEDEDIVRFTPTTLGNTTAGSFALVFDGSDVGLDTASEDIDALARTPDGNLVLSTIGAFSADGVTGVAQDLFVFTDTSLGETTSGTWAIYFDGSDVGLTSASEDIWGVEVAASGDIYLTTYSTYAVTGLSGDSDDLFTCVPGTIGETTTCTFSLYWDGDTYGVGSEWLDALAISTVSLDVTASADRIDVDAAPINQIYFPVIQR